MFLSHKFVDLIVEIANLVIRERFVLDLCDFARDLLEDLATPFFAHGNRVDRRDELGAARARNVNDSRFGSLRRAKAEEHRMRLFRVTRHDCGCVLVSFLVEGGFAVVVARRCCRCRLRSRARWYRALGRALACLRGCD